ncbi:hypothetical protein Bca101_054690 [Brassica carinata]
MLAMERRSLPMDLAEEILSLIPAKSVARLRSTCKGWDGLLKSGSFAKMRTAKAPKEESVMITLIDSRVCLLRINLHDPSVRVVTQPFYLRDPLSDPPKEVDICNIFHCDGLLLCTTKDKRLVVWNPCSGETMWINPRDRYKKTDYYALGYDNNSSNKQYKILRVDLHQDLPVNNEYEIYDFTSNSWKVLGVANDWFLALSRRGVSLKGNTYWVATRSVGRPSLDFLLSFNFTTEMFESLSLPPTFPISNSISALSVVREEELCLLGIDEDHPTDLHVWVATSTTSWRKSITLKGKYEGDIYRYFSKGMSFLADEQNKVVMCLNTNNMLHILREDKKSSTKNHFEVGKRKHTKHVTCKLNSVLLNYVPSLARIQQGSLPGGRKRKSPST